MDSCLFQTHQSKVKRKQPRPGFELGLLVPFFYDDIYYTQHTIWLIIMMVIMSKFQGY